MKIMAHYAGTPREIEEYLEGRTLNVRVSRWSVDEPVRGKRPDENWIEFHNRIADENDRNEQPYRNER